jgi:N-acetyl-anhydromuramyl-L-alanine amidase AmpD
MTVELWIPFAKKFQTAMESQGVYRKGYPEFALVHFTAGRDGTGTISHGIKNKLLYLTIMRDGTLYQCNPLNQWGSHAGTSFKEGYGRIVSRYCVGIEVIAAGKCDIVQRGSLRLFKAWFHRRESEYFPESEMRYSDGKGEKTRGWYHKFTPAQENTLIRTLNWLWTNNPSIFQIAHCTGHEQVATPQGRKNDPSAALSMTMAELIDRAENYAFDPN